VKVFRYAKSELGEDIILRMKTMHFAIGKFVQLVILQDKGYISLKYKRNERFDPRFVIWIFLREMPGKKLLFLTCPEPGGDKGNG
jgi:hypothetical protein